MSTPERVRLLKRGDERPLTRRDLDAFRTSSYLILSRFAFVLFLAGAFSVGGIYLYRQNGPEPKSTATQLRVVQVHLLPQASATPLPRQEIDPGATSMRSSTVPDGIAKRFEPSPPHSRRVAAAK